MSELPVDRPPRAALLTPAGRGALATIAVTGCGARRLVDHCLHTVSGRSLLESPLSRIVFGRWSAGSSGEEVVVGCLSDDEVEVHCHGGAAACQAVLQSLIAAGAEQSTPERWIAERALDPLQAAAETSLARCRTELAAATVLDQQRGALRSALQAVVADLDAGRTAAAGDSLRQLETRAPLGLHLTEPWRIVLAGPPNVGKSSLLNALLGFERALVWDRPGTTRDVVTGVTAFDGWLLELADTAGDRRARDAIEAAGQQAARRHRQRADLVLRIEDAADGPRFDRTADRAPVAILRVLNKCDLPAAAAWHCEGAVRVSALRGEGIERLLRAIVARLVPEPLRRGEAIPFTRDQALAIGRAHAAVRAGQLNSARHWITALLGMAHR